MDPEVVIRARRAVPTEMPWEESLDVDFDKHIIDVEETLFDETLANLFDNPLELPLDDVSREPLEDALDMLKPLDIPFPRQIEAEMVLPDGEIISLTLWRNDHIDSTVPAQVDGILYDTSDSDGVSYFYCLFCFYWQSSERYELIGMSYIKKRII